MTIEHVTILYFSWFVNCIVQKIRLLRLHSSHFNYSGQNVYTFKDRYIVTYWLTTLVSICVVDADIDALFVANATNQSFRKSNLAKL